MILLVRSVGCPWWRAVGCLSLPRGGVSRLRGPAACIPSVKAWLFSSLFFLHLGAGCVQKIKKTKTWFDCTYCYISRSGFHVQFCWRSDHAAQARSMSYFRAGPCNGPVFSSFWPLWRMLDALDWWCLGEGFGIYRWSPTSPGQSWERWRLTSSWKAGTCFLCTRSPSECTSICSPMPTWSRWRQHPSASWWPCAKMAPSSPSNATSLLP